jgi:hypothetical protein
MQAVTSKVEIREAAIGLWKHVHFSTNLHLLRLASDSDFLTGVIHRVAVPSYMMIEYVKLVSQKRMKTEYQGNCTTSKRNRGRGNRTLLNRSTQPSANLHVLLQY